MAYNTVIVCLACDKEKNVTVSSGGLSPNICKDCRAAKEKDAKQKHFEELDQMTLEQRIRRIEEILYDKPWKHTHSQLMRF